MHVCVVVSSIGSSERLETLMQSLKGQTSTNFVVGVCDQSGDDSVRKRVDACKGALDVFYTVTERGLSRGRNSVMRSAPADVTHFLFPNDTSQFDSALIGRLEAKHSAADIVAMIYVDEKGPRHTFESSQNDFDRRSVWWVLEAAMLLSSRLVECIGMFDETLGSGSSGPFQSGEGTDLLIRSRAEPMTVHWDGELFVSGVTQSHGLSMSRRRAKLRSYGRGYGYLLRKYKYPTWYKCRSLIGPIVGIFTRHHENSILDALWSIWGRFEGLSGILRAAKISRGLEQ